MKQYKEIIAAFPSMSEADLIMSVENFRRELFRIRLKAATSQVKTAGSDMRFLRKAVARGLTFLQQRRSQELEK